MKKYRIDFERRVNFGEPITETMMFAYDGDGMTMADAIREFYERYDSHEIMSLTASPVSAFEPRYEDEVIGQMSFFDYSKQSNRYAEGGLVAPEQTGLASGQNGASAAYNVSIENAMFDLEAVQKTMQKVIDTASVEFWKGKRNGERR